MSESDAIESHGIALDKEKKWVKCKYCDKVVHGFSRLKHHLGGVGHDVLACVQALDDVKQGMKNALLEKKKQRLLKQVGELYHPDLPLKRKISLPLTTVDENFAVETASQETSNRIGSGSHVQSTQPTPLQQINNTEETAPQEGGVPFSVKKEDVNVIKEEMKDDLALVASKHIGKFFYEAGIDLNTINLPSFQRMIDAAIICGLGFKAPRYDELKGWILEEDFKEVCRHVDAVKSSWKKTGCSILLDCWKDQSGRSLISFVVDCPQGTVFLRSVDASDTVRDIDAIFFVVSKVIEEVGVQNVVQVITDDLTGYMQAVGNKVAEKYNTIFWTICADRCIDLILDKISMIEHVKEVLTKAKTITQFIYSHAFPLELMKAYIRREVVIRTSRLESVAAFITLENMMSEKDNLLHAFNSSVWNMSQWASKTKGRAICELVKNPSFWASVADVLKVTNPLVGVLHRINRSDAPPMGFLYDSMDRAKEEIKRNLGGEGARYEPFWIIIDHIWNNYLHSHLHSAGYYLNPILFYSDDFFVDKEVANGLLHFIVRMIGDHQTQQLVVLQLDAYRHAIGRFEEKMAIHQRSKVHPEWWCLYGSDCPELQKLAVKTLSQTCSTTSVYKLRRVLSEQLHANARSCIEQQKFADMEFVRSNLCLRQTNSISLEELTSMDDWILED
ncbi:uncharacterized protein LOC109825945 isoform X2 [Asparagus officinalis]|uniref:uncharacterized protein LOC109825945 isoform X2 n=1 Tax=Asparagus officinalis TaxID=4686 RepID=UPI00098E82F0|nr:uncharacterized protein LOC109825945 isoform X2 [Asparagus officinalis]